MIYPRLRPTQPNPLVGFDDLTLHSTRSCGTSRFGICGRQVGREVCEPRLRQSANDGRVWKHPKFAWELFVCLFLFAKIHALYPHHCALQ